MPTVLIIDDEEPLSTHLNDLLLADGCEVRIARSALEAHSKIKEICPDIVFLDSHLLEANGGNLIYQFKQESPKSEFIAVATHGSQSSGLDIAQRGAADFLTKPFDPAELIHVVHNVMRTQILREEMRRLRSRADRGVLSNQRDLREKYPSSSMKSVDTLARKAAQNDGIVLLLGESGTGKDRLARWIHDQSNRAEGPYFSFNCASVSSDQAEAELFGSEPGGGAEASGHRLGLLEVSHGGTLVLSEVSSLSPRLQSKLLTFLDSQRFVRVGGQRNIPVDVRILVATNQILSDLVKDGTFRQDLFFRLNVFPIRLPSLRERSEDISILAHEILSNLALDMARSVPEITEDSEKSLRRYHWPGNVRELRNVLERAIIVCENQQILPKDLNLPSRSQRWELTISFPYGQGLHDVTRQVAQKIVSEALTRAKTKQEAAQMLGISRHALAHQIKMLGIGT